MTYGELDATSSQLARALLHFGLAPGDRVATLTENRPEHVALLFACAKAGLILTPLNWRLTAPEIAAQLQTFEPALVCASPTHRLAVDHARALMASAPPALDLARLSIELGPVSTNFELPHVDDDDGLLIIATSGTTAHQKAWC